MRGIVMNRAQRRGNEPHEGRIADPVRRSTAPLIVMVSRSHPRRTP